MTLFFVTFASLFSVLNPIGNLPIFLGLTHNHSAESKNRTALWAAINVFIILVVAFFIGEYILQFMGITIDVLRIAGGFLICLAGFSLLSTDISKSEEEVESNNKSNIAMTPLAIPLMAGPGSMSLLISMNDEYGDYADKAIIICSVLAVAVSIYVTFRSGNYIPKLLGQSGMVTLSKIIGFLVLAIGIQYVVSSLLIIFKI